MQCPNPFTLRRLVPKFPFNPFSSRTTSLHHYLPSETSPLVLEFLYLLGKCRKDAALVKTIHARIKISGLQDERATSAKLVRVYVGLGNTVYTRWVFDGIRSPSALLCNALLNGYLKAKSFSETVDFFEVMRFRCVEIDSYACNYALKACASLLDYEGGMGVVGFAMEKGFWRNRFLGSAIMSFLMEFGEVE